ncbi:unnamed protein product (mitochondrion) [Plasmodiophora brassicae]|uniref:Uncharacterized protein n=2 Tax=Plasmodiophora brassicae TaxID=37360 RepID=A0A3P3YJR8_PLABS|nr:unnamed protein product [Plasmodiophora brassicae]
MWKRVAVRVSAQARAMVQHGRRRLATETSLGSNVKFSLRGVKLPTRAQRERVKMPRPAAPPAATLDAPDATPSVSDGGPGAAGSKPNVSDTKRKASNETSGAFRFNPEMRAPEPSGRIATDDDVELCLKMLKKFEFDGIVQDGVAYWLWLKSPDGKNVIPGPIRENWRRNVIFDFATYVTDKDWQLLDLPLTNEMVMGHLERIMMRAAVSLIPGEEDLIDFLVPSMPPLAFKYTHDNVEYTLLERHLFLGRNERPVLQLIWLSTVDNETAMESLVELEPDDMLWPRHLWEIMPPGRVPPMPTES